MTGTNQKQLGNTLWRIADQLRGAMDVDDFRDYMLSFLFLRYLSADHETAAMMISAKHLEKGKRQNTLSEENKRRIIDTYQHRTEAPPLLPQCADGGTGAQRR